MSEQKFSDANSFYIWRDFEKSLPPKERVKKKKADILTAAGLNNFLLYMKQRKKESK